MHSKRSQEGYLLMDHRWSPGIQDMPLNMGKGLFECSTITCKHCQQVLIVNPLRTRERGYCPKCDHYVCDLCNLARINTGVCKTFEQVIEETQEAALLLVP